MEATIKGFIEFAKEQPKDREINQSRGWNECAVGDYCGTTDEGKWHAHRFYCDNSEMLSGKLLVSAWPTYGRLQRRIIRYESKYFWWLPW